jgi:hypothetical protein
MLDDMVREASVETRFCAAVLALFGGVGLLEPMEALRLE